MILLSRLSKSSIRPLRHILVSRGHPLLRSLRQLLYNHSIIILLRSISFRRPLRALILLISETPSGDLRLSHKNRRRSVHARPGPIWLWPALLPLPLDLVHEFMVGLLPYLDTQRWDGASLVIVALESNLEDSSESLLALKIKVNHTLVAVFGQLGLLAHFSVFVFGL